jgi:hypothetical protein
VSPARRIHEPAGELPESVPLDRFLAEAPPLEPEARYELVEQALALLEGIYVHLRLKRSMHAVDPVQRLRLLARRMDTMGDQQFHAELAAVFRSLRDLHTVYQLPDPFRGHVATLGFLVERYGDDGYLVTKVEPSLDAPGLEPGVELVAWNGVPIERAVELNAERQAGSNPAARRARGLEALTLRPLRTSPPPDEHWVIVEFRAANGRRRELRIPWRVTPAETLPTGPAQDPVSSMSALLGIDAGNEATRQIKRRMFAKPRRARRAAARDLPAVLDHRTLRSRGRSLGYLRIFSFNVAGARRFLEGLAELLAELPSDGLIVDIRGNPGGHILAAEGALQLLHEDDVVPARFSLATTPLVLDLCRSNPSFQPWAGSVGDAVETGEPFSRSLPLSDPPALAEDLPRYPGPTVLITDALCYSAADMFAAGFQDNGLGPVLGTDSHTGAGGANVWTHELLRLWLPDGLAPLPAATSFRVALRRSTRVRDQEGVPLEDIGVRADAEHALTRRDVTERNQDLIAAAAALLRG